MATLLKKPQVSVVTKDIITKEGECKVHISLDLNINVNANGANVEVTQDEDVQSFLLPEFKMEKVKFGEKVR